MRFSGNLVLAFLALITLSACSTMPPQPMGRGYVNYHKPYKSANGSETLPVGYEYSLEKNIKVMDEIHLVAKALAKRLDEELDYSVDAVYLDMPKKSSVFYSSFDHALRNELAARGYLVSTDMTRATPVVFIAQRPHEKRMENLPEGYETLFIALGLNYAEGKPQTVLGNFYKVPAYQFSPAGPDVDQPPLKKPAASQEICVKGEEKPCTPCEESEKEFQASKKVCNKDKTCKKDKPCSDSKDCAKKDCGKCAEHAKNGDTKPKEICNRLCSKDCDKSCNGKCTEPCGKHH